MSTLLLLIAVFFVVTAIGVVTGSNSLITVPLMFELGIEPKRAIATNMFGLTFMALGATVPFYRQGLIDAKKLAPLTLVTILGSVVGALLVGYVSSELLPLIVSVSMVVVAAFMVLNPGFGTKNEDVGSFRIGWLTLLVGGLLAVYGGFYSGGYMTVMTAVLIVLSGMKFSEAIAGTKFLNLFSSAIATVIFIWQGLVDFELGIVIAVTMFVAAFIGAKTVTRLDEKWLRAIFLTVVFALAFKKLFIG